MEKNNKTMVKKTLVHIKRGWGGLSGEVGLNPSKCFIFFMKLPLESDCPFILYFIMRGPLQPVVRPKVPHKSPGYCNIKKKSPKK